MRICYFGNYDPEYARNRVIIKGLRENGVEVLECNSKSGSWKKYIDLFKIHRKIGSYRFMIVGYSDSRLLVLLGRFLNRGEFLVWDAFYSLYDSWVFDRKLVSPNSVKAKYWWFVDWLALRTADGILLDTLTHIDYFIKTYKIHKNKFIRIFVGTDDSVFYPRQIKRESSPDKTNILFYGKFIPLQGIQYIIKAAKILENNSDIYFRIIGNGQTYSEIRNLARDLGLKNTEFLEKVPYEKLPSYIESADIVLGIFGDTDKTLRVIPNKIYEAVAMAKPVITGDTPAVRELFKDQEDILLCKVASEQDLSKKIIQLIDNKELLNSIASNGYRAFSEQAKPTIIAKNLLGALID